MESTVMAADGTLNVFSSKSPGLRSSRWLAHQIAKKRNGPPRMSYAEVCGELKIFKRDGETPDTGLAILLERGYEPRRADTRARLRLLPATTCPACHRKLKRKRAARLELSPAVRKFWKAVKCDPEMEQRAARLAYRNRAKVRGERR